MRCSCFRVGEDGHGGVAAVDGDDAAAGVGAGAAHVDAGHGGAGGEAVGPHVGRQAFALEDVAAGEADLLLDVGRPEDLGVDDGGVGAVDVGAEAADGAQRECADLVAARVPGAVSECVGDVLREDAHGVLAARRDGGVVRALEVEFAPEMLGAGSRALRRRSRPCHSAWVRGALIWP